MSTFVVALVLTAVLLSAVHAAGALGGNRAPGPTAAELSSAEDYLRAFGGDMAVYERISAKTDCDELLSEYDQATEVNELVQPGTAAYRHSAGYRQLAADRMGALGCF